MSYVLMFLLFLTAFFLIVLILIQRGKGGGLAGAFGGMGGQSAFGTKAGDLFTKITIGVAAFWIVLCVVSVKLLATSGDLVGNMGDDAPQQEGFVQGQPTGEGETPVKDEAPAEPDSSK